ncbi:hypothetical protein S2M10_42960 [Sphingomonas sp. S2M10]|uniref:hypothetical protein n=1 Tax=Sphingomonas sp. S2M10 TaxID=2705010 RepID=UPI001456EBC4|nr:hypothetical protein [Sphingomonas sp. S2M10]NLS29274.1 hypothetical protein [Sphingomonas sp. S2M10]
MLRRSILTAGALILAFFPAVAQMQELNRAYQLFDRHRWVQARDAARAVLAASGRNYSAEFIVAGSECQIHPHRASNAIPFQRILADYRLSDRQRNSVRKWMQDCTRPAPPRQPQQAGVSAQGLSVGPDTRVADPNGAPPLRDAPRSPAGASAPVIGRIVARPAASVSADRCRAPFTWRLAFPGDHVCVTPEVRSDAADDNARAAERRNPNGPYGPMTCINGYVWREARDGDTVCVLPQRRDQAAADNRAAASRRLQP